MTGPAGRIRVSAGDLLLVLAGAALLGAAAYPRAERATLWRRVAGAQADVEAVRAAARGYREQALAWPAPSEAGVVPPELADRLPPGFSFQAGAYTLEWGRWETVEVAPPSVADLPPDDLAEPPPPPADSAAAPPVSSLGALTVHSADERLLAALLERYGPTRSFVRERTWTLIFLGAP